MDNEVFIRQFANSGPKPLTYDDFDDPVEFIKYQAQLGDTAAMDKIYNYALSERSNQIARDWTAEREDSQYARLFADLRSQGINPVAVLQGATPVSSAASGTSYSGSQYSSAASLGETQRHNKQTEAKQFLSALISAIGLVVAVAML